MENLLNPAQRTSVKIVLKEMEENLRQTYQWLNFPEIEGILYRKKFKLTGKKRTKALEKIAQGLELIAQLAESLKLETVEEDLGAAVRGNMSVSWANLMDTRAKKLARFGDVDPRLVQALDPTIERLASVALSLAELV